MGEEVDVEMGGCNFFITLQFSSITFTVCLGKVKFPLLDPQLYPEGSYEIGSVCPSVRLSVSPGVFLE